MSALSLAVALHLAASCAPGVAPETWLSIVDTESGFNGPVIGLNTLAIGDNTSGRSYAPASLAQAISFASALVAAGHSVDLGVAQINSAAGHLQRRGLPLAAAFDPCTGFRVGGEVLADCYRHTGGGDEQTRIRAALGCYNGDRTGAYARRVLANAKRIIPAIRLAAQAGTPTPLSAAATLAPTDVVAAKNGRDEQQPALVDSDDFIDALHPPSPKPKLSPAVEAPPAAADNTPASSTDKESK